MVKLNSFANVGDEAIFTDRRRKNTRRWQGGQIVGVVQFESGVVTDIIVKDKTTLKLPLFNDKVSVVVVPPAAEVKNYDDIVEDYPHLKVVRRRATDPPTHTLFCVKCHNYVSLTQTTVEESELVLWNNRLTASKPSISDGHEEIACGCKGVVYDLEFYPH